MISHCSGLIRERNENVAADFPSIKSIQFGYVNKRWSPHYVHGMEMLVRSNSEEGTLRVAAKFPSIVWNARSDPAVQPIAIQRCSQLRSRGAANCDPELQRIAIQGAANCSV